MIFLSHNLNWDELVFDSLSNTAEASAPSPLLVEGYLNQEMKIFCLFFRHFSAGTRLSKMEKVLDGDWLWLSS